MTRGPTRWFLAKRRPEKQRITSKLIGRPSPLSICLPFLKKASGTVVWVGKLCCVLYAYRVACLGRAVIIAARETRRPCEPSES